MFLESQDSSFLVGCLSAKYSVLFLIRVFEVFVGLFLIYIGKSLGAICGMDFSAMHSRLRSRGGPKEAARQRKEGELLILVFLDISCIWDFWGRNRNYPQYAALSYGKPSIENNRDGISKTQERARGYSAETLEHHSLFSIPKQLNKCLHVLKIVFSCVWKTVRWCFFSYSLLFKKHN